MTRAILIAAALFTLAVTSVAQANIRDSKGRFVFGGSTYRSPSFDEFSDPVAIIYRGGEGRVTTGRVGRHTTDDWPGMGVRTTNFLCRTPQWVPFPPPSYDTARFVAPAMNMSNNGTCLNQTHIRVWGDTVHSQIYNHETTGNFMLGTPHKERVVTCRRRDVPLIPDPYLCFPHKHKISGDWDQARRTTIREMGTDDDGIGFDRAHQVQLAWAVHPTARNWYQGKHHSRVIGRVSMAHRP